MATSLDARLAKLIAARTAATAALAVARAASAEQLRTPQGVEIATYNAIRDSAAAAGILASFTWNGYVMPGACRALHDATGDELAGLLARTYERDGYAAAADRGWPVIERADHLDCPPGGWPPAPASFIESRAYAARLDALAPPQ
jgi:hypothetical protein